MYNFNTLDKKQSLLLQCFCSLPIDDCGSHSDTADGDTAVADYNSLCE